MPAMTGILDAISRPWPAEVSPMTDTKPAWSACSACSLPMRCAP